MDRAATRRHFLIRQKRRRTLPLGLLPMPPQYPPPLRRVKRRKPLWIYSNRVPHLSFPGRSAEGDSGKACGTRPTF